MKYSILVRQYGSDRETELCRVGANPQAIVEAASRKTLSTSWKAGSIPQYTTVRAVERATDGGLITLAFARSCVGPLPREDDALRDGENDGAGAQLTQMMGYIHCKDCAVTANSRLVL
jgi:hypothetical protein